MDTRNAVPGLERGVAILQLLGDGLHATLDELARRTGYPKSSLLRMLETLRNLQLVSRDESTRQYFALQCLTPLRMTDQDFDGALGSVLQEIAESLGSTAEWYVPVPDGMVLVRRAEPFQGGAQVMAHVGFLRPWNEQMEAVASLAHAWRPEAPPLASKGLYSYVRDGIRSPMSPRIAQQRINKARHDGYACDEAFNDNGVRRLACVVLHSNRLAGILGIAECYRPGVSQDLQDTVRLLTTLAFTLFRGSAFEFSSEIKTRLPRAKIKPVPGG